MAPGLDRCPDFYGSQHVKDVQALTSDEATGREVEDWPLDFPLESVYGKLYD